ncbi:MAG: hypothetical protein AMXMBFR8_23080 [Nevskiales bacterium]
MGARDAVGLREAVRRTLRWSVAFAAAFAFAYAAGGHALIDLLTGIPEVRATARTFLPWLVISPLVSVWCYLYDGVFVGATRSREMRIVMLAAALLVFMPVWYAARGLGNHGLWLAFMLFMAARGLGMHYGYRRLLEHENGGESVFLRK